MTDELRMSPEEFNKAVSEEVEKVLSSKEEAQARQEAEEAIAEAKETFERLKAAIEAKDAKLAEYEDALAKAENSSPSEAEVAANEKIVELENEVEKLKHRSEVAEAALETLAREETAANRMQELEEAGVTLEGEDAEKQQYAKVRDMSDEDFESYKSELVALRNRYASSSEEEAETETEKAELSDEEINQIAQSLGCDPQDNKCVALVREVAEKMSEVSQNRRKKKKKKDNEEEEEEYSSEATSDGENTTDPPANKENASAKNGKLSLGEAITRSMDQNFRANASVLEEATQAWDEYYAAKRGEKNE